MSTSKKSSVRLRYSLHGGDVCVMDDELYYVGQEGHAGVGGISGFESKL